VKSVHIFAFIMTDCSKKGWQSIYSSFDYQFCTLWKSLAVIIGFAVRDLIGKIGHFIVWVQSKKVNVQKM